MQCEIYKLIERKFSNGSPKRVYIDRDIWESLKTLVCTTENRNDEIALKLQEAVNLIKTGSAVKIMGAIFKINDCRAILRTEKLINNIEKAHHDAAKSTLHWKKDV